MILDSLRKTLVPAAMKEFFERTAAAEAVRPAEVAAAITIQRAVRGYLLRKRLNQLIQTALSIQRRWRGYLGRKQVQATLAEYNKRRRAEYFAAAATTIQRWWRGYFCRTHIHNFYARRRYLEAIKHKNAEMRAQLEHSYHEALAALQAQADEKAHKRLASNLHKLAHLASTEVRPGIFDSPFHAVQGSKTEFFGTPVEAILQQAVAENGRQHRRLSPIRRRTVQPQHVPEPNLPFGEYNPRLSLQQTRPYDWVKNARVVEETVERKMSEAAHPGQIYSTTFSSHLSRKESEADKLGVPEPYISSIDPTVGLRQDFGDTFKRYSRPNLAFDPSFQQPYDERY